MVEKVPGYAIKKMEEKDAPEVARLRIRCWQQAYKDILSAEVLSKLDYEKDVEMRMKLLNDPHMQNHVARDSKGSLVGFSVAVTLKEVQGTGEIYGLYVSPHYQRQGLGKALFNQEVRDLRAKSCIKLFIWTLEENTSGQKFYERMGGQLSGARKISSIHGENYPEIQFQWKL